MRLKTAEMLGDIDLKRATCERAMCVAVALAPLEYGTQAGDQLAGREGLCEVVISANLETDDLVDFVIAGCEEKHGCFLFRAQASAELYPVHCREAYVEDDEVVLTI